MHKRVHHLKKQLKECSENLQQITQQLETTHFNMKSMLQQSVRTLPALSSPAVVPTLPIVAPRKPRSFGLPLGDQKVLTQEQIIEKCGSQQTFSMSTMDLYYGLNGTTPFKWVANVSNQCGSVTLSFPSLSFTIPDPGGYIYNDPTTNLPTQFWHAHPMPVSVNMGKTACVIYVFNDGSVVVGGPKFAYLPTGNYRVPATNVTYALNTCVKAPPTNYALTNDPSDIMLTGSTGGYADMYSNDFYDDVCAFAYVNNPPADLSYPYNSNFYGVVGRYDNGQLNLNPPVLLYAPPPAKDSAGVTYSAICIQTISCINPTNKKNIVHFCTLRDSSKQLGTPAGYDRFNILCAFTMDGGNTWTTNNLSGSTIPNHLPSTRGDLGALFDDFGNLWMWNTLDSTNNLLPPFEVGIAVSSDGGQTFKQAYQTNLVADLDYPRCAFGGDGQGGHALWMSVDLADNGTGAVDSIYIGYLPVTGLGHYGTMTLGTIQGLGTDVLTNSVCYLNVPEIVVTPQGDVCLAAPVQIFAGNGDNGDYGLVCFTKHTGGITNFTQFSTPTNIFMSNLGGNDFNTSAYAKPVPINPQRGAYNIGGRGLDYDPIHKRLWIATNDLKPNVYGPAEPAPYSIYNMTTFAIYSDDGGKTWSDEIQISDTNLGCRDLTSVRVNPVNGHKAFFWYDGRGFDYTCYCLPYCAILP